MQVQKRSDGISFIVRYPKPSSYDFVKLFNAEKAWASLVSLHNDSIIDKPKREPTPRQVTRSLRRMSSDPSRMSFVFDNGDGRPMLGEDDSGSNRGTALRKKREIALLSRSVSVPIEEDMNIVEEPISRESFETESTTPLSQKNVKRSVEQQWSSVVEESVAYAEKAVEKHELPCSLESFFELFVADNAKYSVPIFMKESGDEEIQCSPWKTDEDGVTKSRTIEYTHPINAPMAPPMARARKEQSYQTFGTNGMILETKTYVADVPMTDCFYVADQILVEPVDASKVVVTMSFGLEFVKSTMFRAIIVRTTKGEFVSFMQRLTHFMSTSLGQAASAAPFLPAAPTPEPQPAFSGMLPIVMSSLLCIIFLLQLWIIMDLRTMKSTLDQLQIKQTECPAIFGLGGLA